MKKKKHARWRWYEILLVGALLGLAVCSTAWLTSYWGQMRAAQQTFEKLAQAVRAAAPQPEEERGEVWQKGVETLQAQNRDCLAWLYSADTGLDYPVEIQIPREILIAQQPGGQQEPYHPRT